MTLMEGASGASFALLRNASMYHHFSSSLSSFMKWNMGGPKRCATNWILDENMYVLAEHMSIHCMYPSIIRARIRHAHHLQ